jgi:flavin-dependent dehydrogenase
VSLTSDVLVVGGGPAGAAAAIWAAHCGLRVVLLERTIFPRHRPGETLHPGAVSIFKQLGVAEQVAAASGVRHQGQATEWAGRRSFAQFGADAEGPWQGYQILRERLDTILMARARDLGVIVLQPQAAVEPIIRGGRVAGIRARSDINAGFVVDATGMRGFLRRHLPLSEMTLSPPLRAYYGYGEGEIGESDVIPSLVGDERGWTWTAQIGPRSFIWTRLDFNAGRKPSKKPALFRVQWHKSVRGADVTWRFVPTSAGRGYFVAGDAAAVLDPAASHGVLRAMMSGVMAAHVISKVTSGVLTENDGVRHYRGWLKTWFEHDVQRLRELYRELDPTLAWAIEASANPTERFASSDSESVAMAVPVAGGHAAGRVSAAGGAV